MDPWLYHLSHFKLGPVCYHNIFSNPFLFWTTCMTLLTVCYLVYVYAVPRGPRKKPVEFHRKIRWTQNFLKDFGWLECVVTGYGCRRADTLRSPWFCLHPCSCHHVFHAASMTFRHLAMNECGDMGDLLDWCRTGGFPVLTWWAGWWLPAGFMIQKPRRRPATMVRAAAWWSQSAAGGGVSWQRRVHTIQLSGSPWPYVPMALCLSAMVDISLTAWHARFSLHTSCSSNFNALWISDRQARLRPC